MRIDSYIIHHIHPTKMDGVVIPLLNSITNLTLIFKLRRICKRWKAIMSDKTVVDVIVSPDNLFIGSKIMAIFPKLISFQGAWLRFDRVNSLPINLRYCSYVTCPNDTFEDPGDLIIKRLKKHGTDLDLTIDTCVGKAVRICRDFLDLADYGYREDVVDAYATARRSKIHLKINGIPPLKLSLEMVDTLELCDLPPYLFIQPYETWAKKGGVRQLIIKRTASPTARRPLPI